MPLIIRPIRCKTQTSADIAILRHATLCPMHIASVAFVVIDRSYWRKFMYVQLTVTRVIAR
jgi:hypothetical protein